MIRKIKLLAFLKTYLNTYQTCDVSMSLWFGQTTCSNWSLKLLFLNLIY